MGGASYTFDEEALQPAMELWENPERESGGTWEEVGTRIYEYIFGKTVPTDYNRSARVGPRGR